MELGLDAIVESTVAHDGGVLLGNVLIMIVYPTTSVASPGVQMELGLHSHYSMIKYKISMFPLFGRAPLHALCSLCASTQRGPSKPFRPEPITTHPKHEGKEYTPRGARAGCKEEPLNN